MRLLLVSRARVECTRQHSTFTVAVLLPAARSPEQAGPQTALGDSAGLAQELGSPGQKEIKFRLLYGENDNVGQRGPSFSRAW